MDHFRQPKLHLVPKTKMIHPSIHPSIHSESVNITVAQGLGMWLLKEWPATLSRWSDEDIPNVDTSSISKQNAIDIVGPITRQQAKQLKKEINAQVNVAFVTNNVEDSSMHSGCCFITLRNDGAYESAWDNKKI
jgi:hypothetical protein